jgi:peptide/nickel transport system permease protein
VIRYVLKRLLSLIPVVIGVVFIVFSIMELTPSNPGLIKLGPFAPQSSIDQINHQLGYDRPFLERFVNYLVNALQGDFGTSWVTGRPVFQDVFSRFPISAALALFSVLAGITFGLPIGILSAIKQYSLGDYVSTVFALLMAAVPGFWLGLMMIILFSLKLGWLPSFGIGSIAHFIMPVLVLAIPNAAAIIRLSRTTMLETIRQDYIRTARAKGASEKRVIFKHALKNALLPVVTVIGVEFGVLLGSTVVVEAVFSMPGLGSLILSAINRKDVPQVLAASIFLAVLFTMVMVAVDIVYAFIDPRIKARYSK